MSTPDNASGWGRDIEYRPKPEDWQASVLDVAEAILAQGTERDGGRVDCDWDDDVLGMRFNLWRNPDGTYALCFSAQFDSDDAHASRIGFSESGIDGLFGPIAAAARGQSPDAAIEGAELTLRMYLQTAPA